MSSHSTQMVLDILKSSRGPMSVPQIQAALQNTGRTPNKTTIYRQIQSDVAQGLIQEIVLKNGVAFYEYRGSHHHHFCCAACNAIQCVDDPQIEKEIHRFEAQLQAQGFLITHHEFNVYGRCPQCQETAYTAPG